MPEQSGTALNFRQRIVRRVAKLLRVRVHFGRIIHGDAE